MGIKPPTPNLEDLILKVYRNRSELERAFSDFIGQSFSQFIRKEDAEKV
jgi:AraC-like DNA-binding protein